MNFELFIATRHLRAKRKGLFAWVTTLIGVAGVTVGVAALIATLSVMNGFQHDIQKKIIGAQSHVVVYGATRGEELTNIQKRVSAMKEVVATSPFSLHQAILTFRNRSTGIVLKGIDPDQEFSVNDLAKNLERGSWEHLKTLKAEKVPGIVLGQELARNTGVWIGQEVVLISPKGAEMALGIMPKMRKFRVVGYLKTGYYEFDSSTAYTLISTALRFVGEKSSPRGLQVRLKNMDMVDDVTKRLRSELGLKFNVRSFKDLNRTLFAALKLEKFVMFTILTLIVLVAAFNIASNLILLTTEKVRDIGLLKAMGATSKSMRRIFWWEGTLIGLLGVGMGTALGLFLSWFIGHYPIVELPADIYYLSRVPVSIKAGDVLLVAAGSMVLCILATVYPACRAAKINPVEAIHYG